MQLVYKHFTQSLNICSRLPHVPVAGRVVVRCVRPGQSRTEPARQIPRLRPPQPLRLSLQVQGNL